MELKININIQERSAGAEKLSVKFSVTVVREAQVARALGCGGAGGAAKRRCGRGSRRGSGGGGCGGGSMGEG
jgi:hypothetical protein